MEIRYDEEGRINSCIRAETAPAGEGVLHVADEKLPEDFLATFALGKYLVRNGKVAENRKYTPPEPPDFSGFLAETHVP